MGRVSLGSVGPGSDRKGSRVRQPASVPISTIPDPVSGALCRWLMADQWVDAGIIPADNKSVLETQNWDEGGREAELLSARIRRDYQVVAGTTIKSYQPRLSSEERIAAPATSPRISCGQHLGAVVAASRYQTRVSGTIKSRISDYQARLSATISTSRFRYQQNPLPHLKIGTADAMIPAAGGTLVNTDVAANADTTSSQRSWAEVEIALLDHFYDPDLQAARAFYAAVAAHDLTGQPVWPILVAPPGCGKAELINPMLGLPNVHLIDSVTPSTFISGRAPEPGKPKGRDGLLERIGNNATVLFPDFSTVLSKHRDQRGEIFSQLRRLYDGYLRKEVGIDRLVNHWQGRLTIGAAVRPAIDKYTSVFRDLGDRFVLIRWKRIGGVDAALTAMHQNHAAKDAAMRGAIQALFAALKSAPEPGLPASIERATAWALPPPIIAVGRTAVERDDKVSPPIRPRSGRVHAPVAAVLSVAEGLDGRDSVTEFDLGIFHRVAFDTLHPARASALRSTARGMAVGGGDVARTTAWRTVQDLEALGIVTPADSGRRTLTPDFKPCGSWRGWPDDCHLRPEYFNPVSPRTREGRTALKQDRQLRDP
jgi:hypothetical protein